MSHRICLAVLVLITGAGLPAVLADNIVPLEASSEPVHVRVLFEEQPHRQAVVAWTTTRKGGKHRLHIDTQPRDGKVDAYARTIASSHDAPFTLGDDERGMAAWSHNVFLDNLKPGTTYYLVVESDGEVSPEYHFITAREDDQPIRLLFGGDSRTPRPNPADPNNDRRRIMARMGALLEQYPDIVAFAHGGDYTNRAVWSQLYHWLNDYTQMTTTKDNRLLPIIPTRGNHDLDVGFEELFWWPNRPNDYYYTTHLSGNIALITLNTEISRRGDQRTWLRQQLESLRPENRWLVVQYHRPAWPSVRAFSSGEGQRRAWVPLFEEWHVDLVCESHDHAMKRTVPIRNDAIDMEKGIIYIGDGGLGVPQRTPDPDRWYLKEPGLTRVTHHVHLFTFTDEQMHVQAFNIEGETVDDFTLTQDKRDHLLAPAGVQ